MLSSQNTSTYTTLDQQLVHLTGIVDQMQFVLTQSRSAAIPSKIYEGVEQLTSLTNRLRQQITTFEDERQSLRALAQIGQVVNSSLDLDVVLQIVMDTIIRLTGAERGILLLRNDQGELSTRLARNWEQESLDSSESAISHTIIYRVANEGLPLLTTNAQEDPRFNGQQSIIAHNLRSILCVPLKVKGEVTGVIYADNRIRSGLFTQKELDLLSAFANQAAVAIENARLFASVRGTLAEVTELKNLMDNVFYSIASGVLTADAQERVMLCNRAAELILGQVSHDIVGQVISESSPPLSLILKPYLEKVLRTDQPVLGLEASPTLSNRGQVDLRFSLSPLKDALQLTQGVAIVMEDLTEKKQLEASRRLFEKMVSPGVIDQLDPDSLQLGGRRSEITVLFADIRNFTSFSEGVSPEELVSVLNRYLAAAADAVLQEEGTIDKFLGDAVMAWFNAPVLQPDHTMRAIRAALAIRSAQERLHRELPISSHLSFGVGINVGDAVLGLVGTQKRLDYTAIGDSVNTTKRIQENSAAGQILIGEEIYKRVADKVIVVSVEPILAKGKRDPIPVYEVVSLR
jgi:adenylate cyclase